MGRTGAIAAVVAASGILIAGAGVSVYAINTSLAAAAPQPTVIEAAATPDNDADPVTAEDLEVAGDDSDLVVPDVTIPPAQPAAPQQAAPSKAAPSDASAPQAGTTRKSTTRATKPTQQSGRTQQAAQRSISVAAARSIGARAAKGQVIGIGVTRHNGFNCFAVKVHRADGSIIIAYIDRPTGAVIDWSMIRKGHAARPAKPATPAPQAQPVAPAPETHSPEPTPTPTPTPTRTDHHNRPQSGQQTQSGQTQTGQTQTGQNWQPSGGTTSNQHDGSDD